MKETVTVEQALNKGRWQLKYLPMIITFSCISGGIFLYYQQIFGEWIIAIGFISGFISGWLVWSYFVNEWKIWAYENVRNIHQLQHKAIDEKLIWSDGSWFEKTEFKSQEQKIKLKMLEQKFLEKDIFKDDISIPKETHIFYSKTGLTINVIVFIVSIAVLLYYNALENIWLKVIAIIVVAYLIYDLGKKLLDNEPQIIINDKGIKLKNEKIISWNRIHNDRVFTKSSGRNSTNYLTFNGEMISIENLTVKFNELENLLHVYRVRSENNFKSQ